MTYILRLYNDRKALIAYDDRPFKASSNEEAIKIAKAFVFEDPWGTKHQVELYTADSWHEVNLNSPVCINLGKFVP